VIYPLVVNRVYANTILTVIELLCPADTPPPAKASKSTEADSSKPEVKMIFSNRANRTEPRIRWYCLLVLAAAMTPLGVASAQDYDAVGKRLKDAVNAGELSGEQARFMLGALKLTETLKPKPEDSNPESKSRKQARAAAEIKEAVAKGQISANDARMRLREMRQAIAQEARLLEAERDERWRAIKNEIEAAVERGDMTREEADKTYAGIKKRIAADKDKTGQTKVNWENSKRRVEAAVERGDMTREEADKTYAGIKKRMAAGKEETEKREVNWENVKRRVEAAVKRGDMTRAEADKTYERLRKQKSEDAPAKPKGAPKNGK
jgi:polyhydroxyalkanoate synthesis regulator phasin